MHTTCNYILPCPQEKVLKAARKVLNNTTQQRFPTDRAGLRDYMLRRCPDTVQSYVTLRASIDMSSVGMDPVPFEFIDPIWVWINQAAEAGASTSSGSSAMTLGTPLARECMVAASNTATLCDRPCAPADLAKSQH